MAAPTHPDTTPAPVPAPASAPVSASVPAALRTAVPGTITAPVLDASDKRVQRDLDRAQTLQIIVKEETPFLPRAAFTLITLASLGGALFTGYGLGVTGFGLVARWFSLWTMGLAGGLLVWRLTYLRRSEKEIVQSAVATLNADLLARATRVGRVVAVLVVVGAAAPMLVPYLDGRVGTRVSLIAAAVVLAAALGAGIRHRSAALVALGATAVLIGAWALADAGVDWHGLVRILHLAAFSLWLGGALWNIFVAMVVGRHHPDVDSVIVGARQLDRFRWVVRFSLPTIIVTGLIMAGVYAALPFEWWTVFPGVLIPLKALTIVALVVIFIMCPLFRQCSPVQGVCNVDDLAGGVDAGAAGEPGVVEGAARRANKV